MVKLDTDITEILRDMASGRRNKVGDCWSISWCNDAADEIDRLRYVLAGVRGAIQTGRNEPLVIWKEQIDIALRGESKEQG